MAATRGGVCVCLTTTAASASPPSSSCLCINSEQLQFGRATEEHPPREKEAGDIDNRGCLTPLLLLLLSGSIPVAKLTRCISILFRLVAAACECELDSQAVATDEASLSLRTPQQISAIFIQRRHHHHRNNNNNKSTY
ncbi:hypothetical protein HanRHA438_Chr00c07g0846461 [Helianthus annuus]|nr:hypothetical protein HanIR_Chr08g0389691 [Helianthus annuus]KAJ0954810.1 hypothetical protein HanRHA438_Chr00c07g0846461 [Helianthus annuus]